ncbi:hypothetical protein KNU63_gp72 [Gordonia phage RogerDodger]|uniref:Uncharacterized protein n=2 Tax=Wizardvirus TaxID=2169658 RepID=A0A6M3T2J3_9CAUD|nr:hypothetical protein KNU63_gp72 [Gordonia phage RogerDodger]YP_010107703.1 hypothetical protein KNV01_gp67 [Gordonia phage Evamon]QDM56154.1 hypothetical protein SEA_ROGERDODGER_72 [Gordonia phage RogerDodger]QJD51562.1 hypothetical protein SEA_EVAMON_67 [Gordonia phage Evamon]UVK62389.1 hypothetical protein SEA_SALVADOR_67 [Gordonia phage Salvador]
MTEPTNDYLDKARDQILEQHPDMDLTRPGVAVLLFPTPETCDCGCGAVAVESAIALDPDAFDDIATVANALEAIAIRFRAHLGEANYQIAEIRRRNQQ